jgi:hypothetical protein
MRGREAERERARTRERPTMRIGLWEHLRKVVKHRHHIQLENVCLGAEQRGHTGLRSAQVTVHKLFDVPTSDEEAKRGRPTLSGEQRIRERQQNAKQRKWPSFGTLHTDTAAQERNRDEKTPEHRQTARTPNKCHPVSGLIADTCANIAKERKRAEK